MIALSKSASFLLESKCVSNLATNNKVAIGRVLPVFLAILFMGGSDQPIHSLADLSLGVHPRSGRSTHAAGQLTSGSTRTALCLIPALLKQACQAGSQEDFAIAYPTRAAAVELLASSYFTREPAGASRFLTGHAGNLWQRPPPSV
jgi:hypothetical protein